MADAGLSQNSIMYNLNKVSPATAQAQLGTALFALFNAHNDLVAKHNALIVSYDALLASLDAANVAGIGNGNTAAYGAAADINAADVVGLPGSYPSHF